MKTAFVTGAAGFVGANVVRDLLASGWRVRALLRASDPASLRGLDVEPVAGDVFAPHLEDAMRGCDGVFHVAALYSLWRRDRAELARVNVEGTRNVLACARRAGVARVVYTSSDAAIGVRAGAPADETYQAPERALTGAYKRSKFQAEAVARAAVAAGQDVVIVNPSTPIGPWDAKPTPTGEIIVRFARGAMPAYVDTGLNLVDVRDVAAGHRLAYERGLRGERYILGNENVPFHVLLERLASITGRPAPRLRLPHVLPLAYAVVAERILAPLGRAPGVAVDGVRMSRGKMYYSAVKAVQALGLPQSDVTAALRDAVAWFAAHGYLTAP
ncbi:MAG: hopanoid-associated sugar epimerase [Candidatus Velthaea sp.]